jgi:glutamine amidotransferase
MSVIIIDYGMSNLGSIRRAAEECGASVYVSDDPNSLSEATHIILPGVGSFAEAIVNLEKMNWWPAIENAILSDKTPLLGICLGM